METVLIAIISGAITGIAPNIALLFGTINRDKRDAQLQRIAEEFGFTGLSAALKKQRKDRIEAHSKRKQHPWWTVILLVAAVVLVIIAAVLFNISGSYEKPGTTEDLVIPAMVFLFLSFICMSVAFVLVLRDEYWAAPKHTNDNKGKGETHR